MVGDLRFSKLDCLYGYQMIELLGIILILVLMAVWVAAVLILKALTAFSWVLVIAAPFVICWFVYSGKDIRKIMNISNEAPISEGELIWRLDDTLPSVVHVGLNEDGGVVCKECVKKSDPEEKFTSSMVEGGGEVTCVDCLCKLN